MENKVLLINPSMFEIYKDTNLKNSVPHYPPTNLLTVAGALKQHNIPVELIDLDLVDKDKIYDAVKQKLTETNPTCVGVTFASALYSQCQRIAKLVKDYNEEILLVTGGAHASAKPAELVKESLYDVAIFGEGEFALAELLTTPKKRWDEIKGIAFSKENGEVVKTEKRPWIMNLDEIPIPMYELINIHDYKMPKSFCRKQPVMSIETSRGCAWGCTYCTKAVFGRNFRCKSVDRTVQEIKMLVDMGVKEIHINDDMFTTNQIRVKQICKKLIDQKIKIIWACPNGIRADRVDKELLTLMKKAGCYRVSFGAESGNQEVLDRIHKEQTPKQVIAAFKLCKEVGLAAYGFFMFGLPNDTEKTMQETIDFAKTCDPDIAKFGIMIPLPSTPIYDEWKGKYITSEKWDDYNFHSGKQVYNHPTLSHEIINKYYKKAYKEFYLRPSYIVRRGFRSLFNGQIIDDLRLFFSTNWFG